MRASCLENAMLFACKRKRAAAPKDKPLDRSSYWWMVARQPAPHFLLAW